MWDSILTIIKSPKTWSSVAIVIFVVIAFIIINTITKRFSKDEKITRKVALQTRVVANLLKYLLLVFAIIIILEINGINVTSLITGLGVLTAVAGFALQDFLKDVIQGFNIVRDSYFKLGDVIDYEGKEWEVIEMSMKATKVKNIDTEDILTIANRNIDKVTVVSNFQNIAIPGSYAISHKKMLNVIENIKTEMKKNPLIKDVVYVGTDAFLDSQISYLLRVYSKPIERDEARRFANATIQDCLEKEGISIPFNQLDVHLDQQAKNE